MTRNGKAVRHLGGSVLTCALAGAAIRLNSGPLLVLAVLVFMLTWADGY